MTGGTHMDVEQFRQYLNDWGVTAQVLAVIGLTSFIVLVISVRIILKWYLGIQLIQDEIAIVRSQLDTIQDRLGKMGLSPKETPVSESTPKESSTISEDHASTDTEQEKARPFRLTH